MARLVSVCFRRFIFSDLGVVSIACLTLVFTEAFQPQVFDFVSALLLFILILLCIPDVPSTFRSSYLLDPLSRAITLSSLDTYTRYYTSLN